MRNKERDSLQKSEIKVSFPIKLRVTARRRISCNCILNDYVRNLRKETIDANVTGLKTLLSARNTIWRHAPSLLNRLYHLSRLAYMYKRTRERLASFFHVRVSSRTSQATKNNLTCRRTLAKILRDV